MKDTVLVTTHERPTPPFSGANHKIHDVIWALQDVYRLEVLVYDPDPSYRDALRDYWTGPLVQTRVVQPCGQALEFRALIAGTLRTALMRDFRLERSWIEEIARDTKAAVLIVDGLSGLPIVEYYPRGVIASVHDCMSRYYLAQRNRSRDWREWLMWTARRRGALTLERRYLHRASAVHVVTQEDADLLRAVNPGAKTGVVPIGSFGQPAPFAGAEASSGSPSPVLTWGDLASPPVREGFRALISVPDWVALLAWGGVTVLGRVPAASFDAEFPSVRGQVRYVERVDDLDSFVSGFQVVVLPDLGGTGQKNRCFDALRLGRCVAGLAEVFRDLPESAARYYLLCKTGDELARRVLNVLRDGTYQEVGSRAARLFAEHLGPESFRAKWVEVVESVPAIGHSTERSNC
jgi:glycosyltransferase involved in cell wall biosynthesis